MRALVTSITRRFNERETLCLSLGGLAILAIACAALNYGLNLADRDYEARDGVSMAFGVKPKAMYEPADAKRVYARLSQRLLPFSQPSSHGLPAVINMTDRDLYQRIFALQNEGKWQESERLANQLRNPILLGHVQAEKLLNAKTKTDYAQLAQWIHNYNDLPQATDIHSLSTRKPVSKGFKRVSFTRTSSLQGFGDSNGLSGSLESNYAHLLNWQNRGPARALWSKVQAKLDGNDHNEAHALLNQPATQKLLKAVEIDVALTSIATSYYLRGESQNAYALATRAAKRSGANIPDAYWTAGLAAWKLGKKAEATRFFVSYAENGDLSGWERSAGAYWAYRGFKASNQMGKAQAYLAKAAAYPRTFYGMLASHKLGAFEVTQAPASMSRSQLHDVLQLAAVQRAIALVDIGKSELAEQEMRRVFVNSPAAMQPALLTIAHKLDLPAVQIRMARVLMDRGQGDKTLDYARYPLPRWLKTEEALVNPALVSAFIREESGFNPEAKSYKGASGLMQLMPATARYVAAMAELPKQQKQNVNDPALNLVLGQAYLAHLMQQDHVGTNLVFLTAAYNAGPGNLAAWQKNTKSMNDPLLFIESMPARETRNYSKQVLASYWMYRELSNQRATSLEALAAGQWPQYEAGAVGQDL